MLESLGPSCAVVALQGADKMIIYPTNLDYRGKTIHLVTIDVVGHKERGITKHGVRVATMQMLDIAVVQFVWSTN